MNRKSIPRCKGQARAVAAVQSSFQEARLWNRARLNLNLLYGGRRLADCDEQGGVNNGVSSVLGCYSLEP
jgi:hypothetical protein